MFRRHTSRVDLSTAGFTKTARRAARPGPRQRRLACEPLEERTMLAVSPQAQSSADAAVQHMADVMDQDHDRVWIYEDISSPGNHFHARGKMPADGPVTIYGSYADDTHAGATSIRNEFCATTEDAWGGFYFMNGVMPEGASEPLPNWGTVPNAGFDLTGAESLTFWAKGAVGGEVIEFFVGGVGRDPASGQPIELYPDSAPLYPASSPQRVFTLANQWEPFTFDLTGLDMSYVLGGFGWVATAASNPDGAVFYLDDMYFELDDAATQQRLNQPRFLKSYTTLDVQPDVSNDDIDVDLRFRNAANSEDNALAILAFLADGSSDSLRRAKLVGDAFVYATEHDRTFKDGRVRSVYMAGDIALPPGWEPDGAVGNIPIPGFYDDLKEVPGCSDESTGKLEEVEQNRSDVGDNAWVMISLLALYQETGEDVYFDAAERIGQFIRQFREDSGTYQGFRGGIQDPETATPINRDWASTEHNLDVYVAATLMHQLTGEAQWLDDARHAREFVDAMWDPSVSAYRPGTLDPETRNEDGNQIPLDAQALAGLALTDLSANRLADIFTGIGANQRNQHDGFDGFDFNSDRDGVWFEGTGQAATAYAVAGRPTDAEHYAAELRRAQETEDYGDGQGIAVASRDGLTTGFDWDYYRRLHVGATAWLVFAQLEINPYYINNDDSGDLGRVGLAERSGLDPSAGDLWYRLETIHGGILTAEAFFQGDDNSVTLEIYDASQTDPPLPTSVLADGSRRADRAGTSAGQTYFVKLSGSNTDVDLRVTNLVDHQGTTVTVHGTDGDDTFEFNAAASRLITINGVEYRFDDAEVRSVTFDGQAGKDVVTLRDSPGDETLTAEPGSVTFAENAGLFTVEATAFEELQAYAAQGGNDKAVLEDSAGYDKFKGDPTVSKLYKGGLFYHRVKFFDVVECLSSGGDDFARLWDSPNNDTLQTQRDRTRLYGDGFDVTVDGFNRVYTRATGGGHDKAYFTDSPEDDTTRARAHKVMMWGGEYANPTYKLTARTFDDVFLDATQGGYDKAKLHDTIRDDVLEATEDWVKLSTQRDELDMLYQAFAFEWVKAYATEGLNTVEKPDTLPFDLILDGDWVE